MSLVVEGVHWELDDRVVLDQVSLVIPTGRLVGLLGPNGSGKSSLLRHVAGAHTVRPADAPRGAVTWRGEDLRRLATRERARRVALVEQDTHADVELSVREVVALGRIPHRSRWTGDTGADHEAVDRALATVGAEHLARRRFSTLSGGERQRVHLARALAQEPELLLLDEPTNHLDIHAQLATLSLVRSATRGGLTALVALHDLNLAASFCDEVVVLAGGRVVAAGAVEDVLTADVVDEVYGVRTTVTGHPRTGRPVLSFEEAGEEPPASFAVGTWPPSAANARAAASHPSA